MIIVKSNKRQYIVIVSLSMFVRCFCEAEEFLFVCLCVFPLKLSVWIKKKKIVYDCEIHEK